jgi:hypothetical protein
MTLARGALRLLLGPLWSLKTAPVRALLILLAVVLLTLITQVGGVILWLSLPLLAGLHASLSPRGTWLARGGVFGAFLGLYILAGFTLVPWAAAALGRPALPCRASAALPLEAANPLFCLTQRHYARPAVHGLLRELSGAMAERFPGTRLRYLDAGFPFLDGFPLLPHVSHGDGRKADLAFFYQSRETGTPVPPPSPFGYWAYSGPRPGEPRPCAAAIFDLRWDFPWLQPFFEASVIDPQRTGALVRWLEDHGVAHGLEKVFLEPHLARRFGAGDGLVRFQGCRAARHDDHLHLQFR